MPLCTLSLMAAAPNSAVGISPSDSETTLVMSQLNAAAMMSAKASNRLSYRSNSAAGRGGASHDSVASPSSRYPRRSTRPK